MVAPGGWESEGPQRGGTGYSEKLSAYLAFLGVPELFAAVLEFLGSGHRKEGALEWSVGRWQGWRRAAEVAQCSSHLCL